MGYVVRFIYPKKSDRLSLSPKNRLLIFSPFFHVTLSFISSHTKQNLTSFFFFHIKRSRHESPKSNEQQPRTTQIHHGNQWTFALPPPQIPFDRPIPRRLSPRVSIRQSFFVFHRRRGRAQRRWYILLWRLLRQVQRLQLCRRPP